MAANINALFAARERRPSSMIPATPDDPYDQDGRAIQNGRQLETSLSQARDLCVALAGNEADSSYESQFRA